MSTHDRARTREIEREREREREEEEAKYGGVIEREGETDR